MTRSLLLGMVIAGLVIGCGGPAAPTPVPSAAPSLGVTTPVPVTPAPATATAAPATATATAAPTAEPTAEPTIEPTVEPTVEPTSEATAPPSGDEGDLILFDEMDDPASGWQTGEQGSLSAAYLDGSLQLTVGDPGQAVWSERLLGPEFATLLVAGAFAHTGGGAMGILCVSESGLYGAALTLSRTVVFFSIIDGVSAVLDSHEDLDIEFSNDSLVGFGLECAGTATGALRMVAVMQGQGTLAVYQNNEGPASFNGVALYGEAIDQASTTFVDQVAAYGIAGSTEGMSPEGEELLSHVPTDWQSQCIDTPSTDEATAVISCFLQTEGTGAELAIFQQQPDQTALDQNYQEIVETFGVESEGTCQSGPNETTWSIDSVVHGRVQCAPQAVGIRFDWTDDQLLILSTLFDLEGDYQNTYNLWIDAGPI